MMKAAALPVLAILSIPSGAIIMTDGLGSTYWIALVVGALITTPLDTFTYLQSMKHGQLSKTAPLHSLWPVTSILGAVIFFG